MRGDRDCLATARERLPRRPRFPATRRRLSGAAPPMFGRPAVHTRSSPMPTEANRAWVASVARVDTIEPRSCLYRSGDGGVRGTQLRCRRPAVYPPCRWRNGSDGEFTGRNQASRRRNRALRARFAHTSLRRVRTSRWPVLRRLAKREEPKKAKTRPEIHVSRRRSKPHRRRQHLDTRSCEIGEHVAAGRDGIRSERADGVRVAGAIRGSDHLLEDVVLLLTVKR